MFLSTMQMYNVCEYEVNLLTNKQINRGKQNLNANC